MVNATESTLIVEGKVVQSQGSVQLQVKETVVGQDTAEIVKVGKLNVYGVATAVSIIYYTFAIGASNVRVSLEQGFYIIISKFLISLVAELSSSQAIYSILKVPAWDKVVLPTRTYNEIG